MAEERDDEQTKETERTTGQQPTGQQNQQPPIAGQQGQQSEFGQQQDEQAGDLASQETLTGGQGATGQTQPGGSTDTLTGERGSGQGGEGFIGSQATRPDGSPSETLDRSDFANQGQGAKEGSNENLETGERKESESDIEGSTDRT